MNKVFYIYHIHLTFLGQKLYNKLRKKVKMEQFKDRNISYVYVDEEKLPETLQSARQLINLKAYRGRGCKLCKNTGISGKTVIFETMDVNSDKIDIDHITRTQKPLKKFLLESGLLEPFIKGANTVESIARWGGVRNAYYIIFS